MLEARQVNLGSNIALSKWYCAQYRNGSRGGLQGNSMLPGRRRDHADGDARRLGQCKPLHGTFGIPADMKGSLVAQFDRRRTHRCQVYARHDSMQTVYEMIHAPRLKQSLWGASFRVGLILSRACVNDVERASSALILSNIGVAITGAV